MDGLAWYTSGRVNRGADPEALLPGARSIVSLGGIITYRTHPAMQRDMGVWLGTPAAGTTIA